MKIFKYQAKELYLQPRLLNREGLYSNFTFSQLLILNYLILQKNFKISSMNIHILFIQIHQLLTCYTFTHSHNGSIWLILCLITWLRWYLSDVFIIRYNFPLKAINNQYGDTLRFCEYPIFQQSFTQWFQQLLLNITVVTVKRGFKKLPPFFLHLPVSILLLNRAFFSVFFPLSHTPYLNVSQYEYGLMDSLKKINVIIHSCHY